MLPALRTALLKRGSLAAVRATRSARPVGRRGYASDHGHSSGFGQGSDTPWIIGSIAFTVPAVGYLLSGSGKPSHDAHGPVTHGDKVHHPASFTDAAKKVYDDVPKSVDEAKAVASNVAKGVKDTVETAKNTDYKQKASDAVDAAKEKASNAADAVSSGAEKAKEGAKDKVKGAKEEVKETVSSDNDDSSKDIPTIPQAGSQHPRGVNPDEVNEPAPGKRDLTPAGSGPSAGSRDPKSMNEQTGKQEGLSNTTTWHANMHDERGKEISKKAEGIHDTVKVKGTVDPKREGS